MPEKHKVYKYQGICFENLSDQIPNAQRMLAEFW